MSGLRIVTKTPVAFVDPEVPKGFIAHEFSGVVKAGSIVRPTMEETLAEYCSGVNAIAAERTRRKCNDLVQGQRFVSAKATASPIICFDKMSVLMAGYSEPLAELEQTVVTTVEYERIDKVLFAQVNDGRTINQDDSITLFELERYWTAELFCHAFVSYGLAVRLYPLYYVQDEEDIRRMDDLKVTSIVNTLVACERQSIDTGRPYLLDGNRLLSEMEEFLMTNLPSQYVDIPAAAVSGDSGVGGNVVSLQSFAKRRTLSAFRDFLWECEFDALSLFCHNEWTRFSTRLAHCDSPYCDESDPMWEEYRRIATIAEKRVRSDYRLPRMKDIPTFTRTVLAGLWTF